MDKRDILIHLHHARSISRKRLQFLYLDNKRLENIFKYTISDLQQLFSIQHEKALAIYKDIHSNETKVQVDGTKASCDIMTIDDLDYPKQLRNIPDPPLVLYTKGDKDLLHEPYSLSVIGTRRPSTDAQVKIDHILSPIVGHDWVITSGFALGIDGMAHRYALQAGGKTIAVLGGGFHTIYPQQHAFLFEQISKKGLLLTEYPPHLKPQRYHFPERNRIISGLSLATLVIEATERSGTMITVDQALEQGKEVYVLPGNPFQLQTIGCHRLIQEGAKLIVSGEEILTDW